MASYGSRKGVGEGGTRERAREGDREREGGREAGREREGGRPEERRREGGREGGRETERGREGWAPTADVDTTPAPTGLNLETCQHLG